jgi:hypothetical protein
MGVQVAETVDLFGVGAGVARGGVHISSGMAGETSDLAPSVTPVDLIDLKSNAFGVPESFSNLLFGMPTSADHVTPPSATIVCRDR